MLDASKIGHIDRTIFGTLEDFDYVITDQGISQLDIQQIRNNDTCVIVCGKQTTSTYPPAINRTQQAKYRIGFANLSEYTPFSRDVRRSLEKAARESEQVELVVADNQLDPQIALKVADELLAQTT